MNKLTEQGLTSDDYTPDAEVKAWCSRTMRIATRNNPSIPEIRAEDASFLETHGYERCKGSENLTRLVQTIKNLRG